MPKCCGRWRSRGVVRPRNPEKSIERDRAHDLEKYGIADNVYDHVLSGKGVGQRELRAERLRPHPDEWCVMRHITKVERVMYPTPPNWISSKMVNSPQNV